MHTRPVGSKLSLRLHALLTNIARCTAPLVRFVEVAYRAKVARVGAILLPSTIMAPEAAPRLCTSVQDAWIVMRFVTGIERRKSIPWYQGADGM